MFYLSKKKAYVKVIYCDIVLNLLELHSCNMTDCIIDAQEFNKRKPQRNSNKLAH